MNFVQPASKWRGELLHGDCGVGDLVSFVHLTMDRSVVYRKKSVTCRRCVKLCPPGVKVG